MSFRRFWAITGLLTLASVLGSLAGFAAGQDLPTTLQEASVTIRTDYGQGSGSLFTRGDKTFVWTCAHVVDSLRQTRDIIRDGSKKTLVEFKDASIVQEFRENGRRVGETVVDAAVLKYSDAEAGHDLALLLIRKRNFSDACITFANDEVPQVGTELIHVGSLRGQVGSNSVTDGLLSQVGRVLDLGPAAIVFDQVSTPSFPGSSGGGVFRKSDGKYVGMLVRGGGETFGFVVPTRRIWSFCRDNDILWAVDPSIEVPSDAELSKISVEDTGSASTAPARVDRAPTPAEINYPYLLAYPEREE